MSTENVRLTDNAADGHLATWDNIDRAVTISFRPIGLSRAAIGKLYDLARSGPPISYEIASQLLQRPGSHVGILTGAAVPDHLPKGENDGPLGAMALGHALRVLGYRVTYLTETELHDIFEALATVYGRDFEYVELAKDSADDHASTAMDLDVLVSIEKLGSNAKHVLHGATGTSREGTRAHVDGLVGRMNAAGCLTVGIGDGGNEIGFGKLYDAAREIVDFGKTCRCPCGDGIVTATPTRILYPAAVSNWGAYAVVAALAAETKDFGILHTPERELELLTLATSVDCRDGGTGVARDWVDGVPGPTSAAIVQILRTLAETVDRRGERAF